MSPVAPTSRLPLGAAALALLALAPAACSRGEDPDGPGGGERAPRYAGGEGRPETGEVDPGPGFGGADPEDPFAGLPGAALPAGVELSVDGLPVDGLLVRLRLGGRYAAFADQRSAGEDPGATLDAFFADPAARCAELVEEVLLLREAARRFPELPEAELAVMAERLRFDASRTFQTIEASAGAEVAAAYVRGRLGLEKLEAEFLSVAQPPSEQELFTLYEQEVVAHLPPPEQRVGEDVSFAFWEPRLRERLVRERGLADQAAWVRGRVAEAEMVLSLPGREPRAW